MPLIFLSSLICSYFIYCKSINVWFISSLEMYSYPHSAPRTKSQCHIAEGATTESRCQPFPSDNRALIGSQKAGKPWIVIHIAALYIFLSYLIQMNFQTSITLWAAPTKKNQFCNKKYSRLQLMNIEEVCSLSLYSLPSFEGLNQCCYIPLLS